MKKLLFLSICLLFTSGLAGASQFPNPLLVKTISPGMTPPWAAVSSRCEIFFDKVVITRKSGSLKSKTERKIILSGDAVQLIKSASLGSIVETPAPTDGPTTIHYGIRTVGAGAPVSVTLRARGSMIIDNDSNEAQTLVSFLDQNCF